MNEDEMIFKLCTSHAECEGCRENRSVIGKLRNLVAVKEVERQQEEGSKKSAWEKLRKVEIHNEVLRGKLANLRHRSKILSAIEVILRRKS